MENADLTIVIPVYNQPELLEYTLWQMKYRQSMKTKAIVIDDASDMIYAEQQKVISGKYDALYIYEPCYPKRMRKTACASIGIYKVDTEFVGVLDVHGHYDDDYIHKCYSVLSKYKNALVSTHWFWLKENIIELLLGCKTLRHLDGSEHSDGCNCINYDYYCRFDNIKSTIHVDYYDGNTFLRTEIAKLCYDINIYGYSFAGDIALSALHRGQSIIVIGDVHYYHISHYKQSIITNQEYEKVTDYLNNKYKSWGDLPKYNELILI